MRHTKQQIEDWRDYEDVRQEGKYNMYDPNARILTGLNPHAYIYCMKYYDTLQKQAQVTAQETP